MTTIKTKILSVIAFYYLFTGANAFADNQYSNDDVKKINSIEKQLTDLSNNIVTDADYFNTFDIKKNSIITSTVGNDTYIEWKSLNNAEFHEYSMPEGKNDKGLSVRSYINNNNSYSVNIEDISINTQDFPIWALSKYSSVDEVIEAAKNINIIKNDKSLSLSYEFSDKNNNKVIINVINGDIEIS